MGSHFRFTTIADGSFALSEGTDTLQARAAAIVDAPVTWLRQVHGANCVVVDTPGGAAGGAADAAVSALPGAALRVITADCAPVLLQADGVIGAAHAGWRGLVGGVLEATVEHMRALGAGDITAHLGPCIRSRCYAFSEPDLDRAAAVLGDSIRSTTAWDTPAFDVTQGVHHALGRVGVTTVFDEGICTACSPVHWSHRARGDTGRQAAMIWLDP